MKRALIIIPETPTAAVDGLCCAPLFTWYGLWDGLERAGVAVTAIPLRESSSQHPASVPTEILVDCATLDSFDAVFAPPWRSLSNFMSRLNATYRVGVYGTSGDSHDSPLMPDFSHHVSFAPVSASASGAVLPVLPCIPEEFISLDRVSVGSFTTSPAQQDSADHFHRALASALERSLEHLDECSSNPEPKARLTLMRAVATELRTIRSDYLRTARATCAQPGGIVEDPSPSDIKRLWCLALGFPIMDTDSSTLPAITAETAMESWLAARNEALFNDTSLVRAWDIIRWLENGVNQRERYINQYIPRPSESLFYSSFFNKGCDLNTDEQSRLNEIHKCFSLLINRVRATVKTLDVGCGRGWLTDFASHFGPAVGIEPIPEVIQYARTLFPTNTYHVATPELCLRTGQQGLYDVCLCSEVIEHVPNEHKQSFIIQLQDLLKPQGYIVLTTPRGERYDEWMSKYGTNKQPVEDWISEDDLLKLASQLGLTALYKGRAGFISDIYQVWLFQRL